MPGASPTSPPCKVTVTSSGLPALQRWGQKRTGGAAQAPDRPPGPCPCKAPAPCPRARAPAHAGDSPTRHPPPRRLTAAFRAGRLRGRGSRRCRCRCRRPERSCRLRRGRGLQRRPLPLRLCLGASPRLCSAVLARRMCPRPPPSPGRVLRGCRLRPPLPLPAAAPGRWGSRARASLPPTCLVQEPALLLALLCGPLPRPVPLADPVLPGPFCPLHHRPCPPGTLCTATVLAAQGVTLQRSL